MMIEESENQKTSETYATQNSEWMSDTSGSSITSEYYSE